MKLDKRLTDALARTVELKPGEIAWDGETAGFGVRQHPSGLRAWHVQYSIGRRARPMSLGPIAAMPAARARAAAIEILAKAKLGGDPSADKRRARDDAGDTFGGMHLKRYLAYKRSVLKPRSLDEITRHLMKHAAPLHARLIREIDRKTAASLLARIAAKSGGHAADAVRGTLGAYSVWLMAEGLADVNPFVTTLKRTDGKTRTRTPSLAELVEIWNAADDGGDYAAIIRLLILLGARRAEVGSLLWGEVDLGGSAITLPPARMKHNHQHAFALPEAAVEILRGRARDASRPFVFGRSGRGFIGWSRALERLQGRIFARRRAADPQAEPMPKFAPHDFRRSVATIMSEVLDVPPHIVAEVLAHRTFRRGSEGVYNRAQYVAQKRVAVERWAALLLAAIEGRDSVVAPLARALPVAVA
jgi:integrase